MPLKVADPTSEPTLNLTPMIDIVFLLIIFFMVGTQFSKQESRYEVQVPAVSDAPPLTSRPDEIVVNVAPDGQVSIRNEQMTIDTLEQRLKLARENYSDQTVVVRGSGPDPYQNVMDVLAACHRAKIDHISLANRLQDTP
ncbi:MAG: biopolymer transporter ExbD [Planctomycetota bacterium]|nr:biopolymer transporter ExbD [Planctomycetota bacterium]